MVRSLVDFSYTRTECSFHPAILVVLLHCINQTMFPQYPLSVWLDARTFGYILKNL